MRDKFRGFYRPTEKEFERLWGEALFVLDANVLLNLYRYPTKASSELLDVLDQVSQRLWVPYHAALEFQINRPRVIAEQGKRFEDVRGIVDKAYAAMEGEFGKLQLEKRHAAISAQELLGEFRVSIQKFKSRLSKLEGQHIKVSGDDPIRERLDNLLRMRVGEAPQNQAQIEDFLKEAKERYSNGIPPGYMDAEKSVSSEACFHYGGLSYPRELGDIIVWKQLIERAKDPNVNSVIFVTDDGKEDWWLSVNSQGLKTLGPRPELIDEILRGGDLDHFYMYKSDRFLEFSKIFLKSPVSEESIQQVRDVSRAAQSPIAKLFEEHYIESLLAENYVASRLHEKFPEASVQYMEGFPDLVFEGPGLKYPLAVEVGLVSNSLAFRQVLSRTAENARQFLADHPFWSFLLVYVVSPGSGPGDLAAALEAARMILPPRAHLLIGRIEQAGDKSSAFLELARTFPSWRFE